MLMIDYQPFVGANDPGLNGTSYVPSYKVMIKACIHLRFYSFVVFAVYYNIFGI